MLLGIVLAVVGAFGGGVCVTYPPNSRHSVAAFLGPIPFGIMAGLGIGMLVG